MSKSDSKQKGNAEASRMGLQLVEASSCIQQCSVGKALRRNIVLATSKNHLLSVVKYRPNAICSDFNVLYSVNQILSCNRKENHSVYDDLKPNPDSSLTTNPSDILESSSHPRKHKNKHMAHNFVSNDKNLTNATADGGESNASKENLDSSSVQLQTIPTGAYQSSEQHLSLPNEDSQGRVSTQYKTDENDEAIPKNEVEAVSAVKSHHQVQNNSINKRAEFPEKYLPPSGIVSLEGYNFNNRKSVCPVQTKPKLDRVNKERLRGTTGIAVHSIEGIGGIIDKRFSNFHSIFERPREKLIVFDKARKWYICSNIMVLMIGDAVENYNMKEVVVKQFPETSPWTIEAITKDGEDDVMIDVVHALEGVPIDINICSHAVEEVATVAANYMANGRQKKIEMAAIICGWSRNNQRLEIHTIKIDANDNPVHTINIGSLEGSGKQHALKIFDDIMQTDITTGHMYNQQSDWNSIEHAITQSLVTASLRDRQTGGGYIVFRVRRDRVEVVKDRNFLESCCAHSHIFCGMTAVLLAFSDSLNYNFITTTLLERIPGAKYVHRLAHLSKSDADEAEGGFYLHCLQFDSTEEAVRDFRNFEVHGESEFHFQSLFPYRFKCDNGYPDLYVKECTREFLLQLQSSCKELHPHESVFPDAMKL